MKLYSDKFHWPILGHSEIKKYLQSLLINKTLGTSYLFSGPEHVGKFLVAQNFSATILCQSSDQKKPCQACNSCKQLDKNIHADFHIVKKADDKKNITINQIRELQHKLSLRSFLTEYKIAIIDEAERMNEEAANALLKTLEEPTSKTIFILVCQNRQSLPQTIISRCQQLNFTQIPITQIENWVIHQGKTASEAKIIASYANGRPGIAKTLLNDTTILDESSDSIKIFHDLIKGGIIDKIKLVDSLIKQKTADNYQTILQDWSSLTRDILLLKNKIATISNTTFKNSSLQLAKKLTNHQLINISRNIANSQQLIDKSVNPRLVFENLALGL